MNVCLFPDQADGPAALRYLATQAWPDGPRRLGVVLLDADGRLAIEQAPPEQARRLDMIVQTMNSATALHVQIPPPEGVSRYAIVSRMVTRQDTEFLPTLREQLLQYYDVSLDPV